MLEFLNWFGLLLLPVVALIELILRFKARRVKGWRVRATTISVVAFFAVAWIGEAWGALIGDFHVFDGASLGTIGGTVVGILTYEFLHYWYHRAVHRWDVLWLRVGHQMHHSAEHVDVFGAYFGHPVDLGMFTTIAVLVLYVLLGLSPEAAALTAAFLGFNAVFQHADIATPKWLGYLIQRPESHRLHHARGVHHFNYADLPLWDIVFGTFRNRPKGDLPQAGFHDGASARVFEMLIGRDVSSPTSQRRHGTSSVEPVADNT